MVYVAQQQKSSFDFIIAFSTIILITIGLLFIYSSGVSADGTINSARFLRQLLWAISGIFISVFVYFIHPSTLRSSALAIYIACIVILILTASWGKVVNGARSWIGIGDFGIQPSEFAKIITILFLADTAVRYEAYIKRWYGVFFLLLVGLLPAGLIMLQPDLGTAIVYPPIIFTMLFIAQVRLRYLAFLFLGAFIAVLLIFITAWDNYRETSSIITVIFTNKNFLLFVLVSIAAVFLLSGIGYFVVRRALLYWITYFSLLMMGSLSFAVMASRILKPYQLMRLISFIDPYVDSQAAGWHIIQSITAVGSGGLFGRGYLSSTQSQYHFLPEKNTDFIFSLLAEESGFIGSLVTLVLFFLICFRAIRIVKNTKNRFIQLVSTGIATMFAFHVFVNIGMVIGIMPVTGIPLFFLSYGGSAMWTALIAVAILLCIYNHAND